MALYAIGDLHFSPQNSKPMDIFGWGNHREKILSSWHASVTDEDVVILAGDISWALKFEEAKENLDEINALPGKKIILKGNHDYWWQSVSKMSKAYPEIFFLHNNCYLDEKYLVVGTRGWVVPQSVDFTQDDLRVFERELGRLNCSLLAGKAATDQLRVAAMHYPPVNEKNQESSVTKWMQEHKMEHMLYGHLHGPESFKNIYQGEKNGTLYHLVSADYLDFQLKKIAD